MDEELEGIEGIGTVRRIDAVLTKLHLSVPELEGFGLVSAEGLPIHLSIPMEWESTGMGEDYVCAVVSGLVGIAETSGVRFQKKGFERVTVKFTDSYFAAVKVNDNCYLFVIASDKVKLGMLHVSMDEAAKSLAPYV
ncbi:MAG: roadblock/LC7 domain-containing protein [candidate division WOR-3 bacterium]